MDVTLLFLLDNAYLLLAMILEGCEPGSLHGSTFAGAAAGS